MSTTAEPGDGDHSSQVTQPSSGPSAGAGSSTPPASRQPSQDASGDHTDDRTIEPSQDGTPTAGDAPASGDSSAGPHASSRPRPESSGTQGSDTSPGAPEPNNDKTGTAWQERTATSSSSPQQSSAKQKSSTCSADELDIGISIKEPGGGAAGSQYALLIFKNTSSTSCKLIGHAGVSFVGKGNGTKLGDSAKWTGSDTTTVKLKPGETAPELLQIAQAGNYDAKECAPTTADGFRVYPPRSYSSVLVKHEIDACQRKGPHQLTLSPVGTKE